MFCDREATQNTAHEIFSPNQVKSAFLSFRFLTCNAAGSFLRNDVEFCRNLPTICVEK